MIPAVLALQMLLLVAVVALWLRAGRRRAEIDPRHAQLPDQVASLVTRGDRLEVQLRESLGDLRRDASAEAAQTRDANGLAFASLRSEVHGLMSAAGLSLGEGLAESRREARANAEALRVGLVGELKRIESLLEAFVAQNNRHQLDGRDALHTRLTDLSAANVEHHERLRGTVEASLGRLNADNTAKLEEMRATVDEKLQTTLHTRLTESFGQVTDQLNKVHVGLGEMTKLSEGVDDLSRIFTNVKSRGGFAEVQLGMLLEQMLAPGQFVRNARVKANTLEVVEFAVRFPGAAGESTLLPIDAKFPREDWERLESAYTANDPEQLAVASRAFEAAIRTEGKRICEKYINPPTTTPHAIMFLPTEGLYAEVMRRDALQAEIQSKCQVTIAGPSTLSAILTSFQMGFHMLALQQKGDEVWKVLERTKTEFGSFEKLMSKMETQVGTVQNTIQSLGVRTRAINRNLREVSKTDGNIPLEFEEPPMIGLRLAAVGERD